MEPSAFAQQAPEKNERSIDSQTKKGAAPGGSRALAVLLRYFWTTIILKLSGLAVALPFTVT